MPDGTSPKSSAVILRVRLGKSTQKACWANPLLFAIRFLTARFASLRLLIDMGGPTLAVRHCPVGSCDVPRCLTQLLQSHLRVNQKHIFPPGKAFSVVLRSSFTVKSGSDKAAATAASMLISLAAAKLAVAS